MMNRSACWVTMTNSGVTSKTGAIRFSHTLKAAFMVALLLSLHKSINHANSVG
ncbi:hypothetical protein [Pseudodesulfovibrio sp. JC047]|uniref:hypothetical protein n=1 Tax=Pseudodesulfovibrio sp. JC047 TaxID=2683199 RepID=UPI001EF16A88|nr:hypothetical protein [Pseudodesulfovibrio sp. JC047]